MNKMYKVTLYYICGVLMLTVVWNIALHIVILPKYFIKTEAKVVELQAKRPVTRRGGRQVNQFPVYEYKDEKGELRTLVSQDGFNSINGFLFKKEIGQIVNAYYEKGSTNGLFITGTGDWYTFVLAPIIFGIFPLGLLAIIVAYFIYKRNESA